MGRHQRKRCLIIIIIVCVWPTAWCRLSSVVSPIGVVGRLRPFFVLLFFRIPFHELSTVWMIFLAPSSSDFLRENVFLFKCMKCCVQWNCGKVSRIFHSRLRFSLILLVLSSSSRTLWMRVSFLRHTAAILCGAVCHLFKMTYGKVQSISH